LTNVQVNTRDVPEREAAQETGGGVHPVTACNMPGANLRVTDTYDGVLSPSIVV
jgi:hypothetical protein